MKQFPNVGCVAIGCVCFIKIFFFFFGPHETVKPCGDTQECSETVHDARSYGTHRSSTRCHRRTTVRQHQSPRQQGSAFGHRNAAQSVPTGEATSHHVVVAYCRRTTRDVFGPDGSCSMPSCPLPPIHQRHTRPRLVTFSSQAHWCPAISDVAVLTVVRSLQALRQC